MANKQTNPRLSSPRVWTMHCGRPSAEGVQLINDQLRKSFGYFNARVAIEADRRAGFRTARAAITDLAPLEEQYAALSAQLETERTSLRLKRGSSRKRVRDPEAEARIKALQAERKAMQETLRVAREQAQEIFEPGDAEFKRRVAEACAAVGKSGSRTVEKINPIILEAMLDEAQWPEEWKAKRRSQAEATARANAARGVSGLFPGTYLLVDKALQAASKARVDPEPKRFFDGTGRVGVQILRERLSDIFAGDSTRLQIDPLPENQWDTCSGRRHARTTMRIRLASDDARRPVWVSFPLLIHRKLPADALVTDAWIRVRRVGSRIDYALQLTLQSEQFNEVKPHGPGVVAIDLGWRMKKAEQDRLTDGGIRVGYAVDDAHNEFELLLPMELRRRLDFCSELRSHADKHFGAAKAALGAWCATHPEVARSIVLVDPFPSNAYPQTQTLPEAAAHLHLWHSTRRFARVAGRLADAVFDRSVLVSHWYAWRTERKRAGQDLFAIYDETEAWCAARRLSEAETIAFYIETWRRKNAHLYKWECEQRDKVLARRLDLYRNWAAKLTRMYKHIVIEDFDLRRFARNSKPEEDSKSDHTHRVRTIAAPSEMRLALYSAAGPKRVSEVKCAESTQQCHLCGHVNKAWERPETLVQECAGCHASWDQDRNAGHVLLARWYDRLGGDGAATETPTDEPPMPTPPSAGDGSAAPRKKTRRAPAVERPSEI